MSAINDEQDLTNSEQDTVNHLQPVTIDLLPIIWQDNDATIEGTLHEVIKYYKRNGHFLTLVEDRAVAVSGGRLAISDIDQIPFILKDLDDPRGFDNPCPPTATRVSEYDMNRPLSSPAHKSPGKIPDSYRMSIVVAPHAIRAEDAKLLKSLSYVFGKASSAEEMLDAADGSGLKFLEALRARAASANAKDKAIVAAIHSRVIREGVPGELNLAAFQRYVKVYKAAKRNMPPAARQEAAAEVEMISLIAIKDPTTRELWELKTTASPPVTLDSAISTLTSILRGRLRAEQLDQAVSGTTSPADFALSVVSSKSAEPPPWATALAAAGLPASVAGALKPEHLQALAAVLGKAVPDPRKTGTTPGGTGQDKDKDKVEIPRGADGKPNKWVPGMTLCRCGIDGGKHLFKDCPEKSRKESERKAKKAAKDAKKAAAALAAQQGDSAAFPAELRSALASFLGVPAELAQECDKDEAAGPAEGTK